MKKIITIIILGIISLFLISFIFLPKESFSEIENRNLANFPKLSLENLLDGSYMEDIESYLNDNFPLRTIFMNIRTVYSKIIGKQDINEVYFGKDNFLLEQYNKIDYEKELYNTINKFSKNNPDIKINLMLIPTKISIYQDKLPKNANSYNQEALINSIYSKIDENVNKISLYKPLIKEKDNYQLYYKTDHHWTTFGAYIGYKEFLTKNNIEYINISDYNIQTITNDFKGSTYSKVVDPFSNSETIDIFSYKDYELEVDYVLSNKQTDSLYNYEYLNKKDKYALFLDNNHPLITIENKNIKNNNILIIKDSYANSMIPLLINHYNKIHVIDPRYYKKSITNYIKENKIENVLIMYNVGTLSTDRNILSIR